MKQDIIRAEQSILGTHAKITPTSLIVTPGTKYEEWVQIGKTLQGISRAIGWWLGDWIRFGEAEYGEKYTQAIDATGLDYGYLNNLVYVCNAIDFSCRHEKLSFTIHAEVASVEPDIRNKLLDTAEKKEWHTREMREAVKKYNREKEANKHNNVKITDDMIDFRYGDFRKVLKDIPPNSIDLILTDPPYPEEYLPLWKDLGELAYRVLKPGKFCVAYSGQMHLPEVIKAMSTYMEYYWTMCVYLEGKTQIVNGVNMICRWKPILLYQKQPKHELETTIQDYIISEQREKSGHDWQQSESGGKRLVELFSEPGQTILDPFAGSGTTLICAKELKRKSIGCEIDKTSYNIAKGRISGKT